MNNISTQKYTPVQRFWRLLKPDIKEVRDIYTYAAFNGLIGLSLPLGLQAIINLIQGGQVNSAWIILVSIVVLGVAFTGILQVRQLRITENLQQKIFTRAALELAYRIPRVKGEELYDRYAPELMNRFFDTLTVQKSLSKILIDFSTAALHIIFGLILLSIYHPFFILFSLLLLMVVFTILRFTASRGLSSSLNESQHKYAVAHWLQEVARTSLGLKMAGKTEMHLEKADENVGEYLTTRETHFRVLVQQYSLLVVFKVLVAAAFLAIGGMLVMEERMNLGQFIAAEIVVLLIMSSVEKLILSMETVYDVLTALEKIGQVTDMSMEEEGDGVFEADATEGLSVDISSLRFAFPGELDPVLRGVDIHISSGEHVVLQGPPGSGRRTLLRLIAGVFGPQKGTISFDGIPIKQLNHEALRAEVGTWLSDDRLIEASLEDNITLKRENISKRDLRWAIEVVGLNEFVRKLPDGMNTMIMPASRKFTQTTIQKILLARSIVHKPRLLLYEDLLYKIATPDRLTLLNKVRSELPDATVIYVADDYCDIGSFDRIISFDPVSTGEPINPGVLT